MPRKRKLKESDELGASTDSCKISSDDISVLSDTDSITESVDTSSDINYMDAEKGRHFWYVVYPSKEYIENNYPDCPYDGHDGWGTSPDDWIEQLVNTGLAFNVSELHQFDKDFDKYKKPHHHVIVSWGNTTTYRTARGLCDILKSPLPRLLRNVTGAYRYHRHLDNPEKHQYGLTTSYNGWTPPLDSNEIMRIKQEIKEIVLLEDIQEYAELLIVCDAKGVEYFDVAANNTFYCEKLCSSYRHNPIRVLMRFYDEMKDGEMKDMIYERIRRLGENEIKGSCTKREH